MTRLPVQPAYTLAIQPPEHRWLIEGLWAAEAVGIVGGEPKCCKSFLALDVAVAVASGAPCLRWFRPARTGRVLLFAAEDAPHVVRARLAGIARAAGVAFETLDLQVITAQTTALQNQRNDIDIMRRRIDASVLLVKAIGGGWDVAELPKQ